MRYKCVKELCIPKCDGGGFEIPNTYGYVETGSIWEEEEDKTTSICGGEIHLECVSGTDDFGWIEISRLALTEAFVPLNENLGGTE